MIITLYSLFAVIHLTSSITVDIPSQIYEFARGGTGTIPCNFKPKNPNNPTIITTWSQHPSNPDDSEVDILTNYYSSAAPPQVDVSDEFAGRATVQLDVPKGWVNLTLSSLTSMDSKVFQCAIKIPGDSAGKLSDTAKVVVLVAPSKPICAIQGKAEFYQNISLTCRSDEGTPAPAYQWKSYDVSNNPRQNPPKSTDLNGVLSLYNISAETSGYYICTSTNKVGSSSCNLTLAVMPYSMNLGSTAGIIGGCAAVLLLLIIIICCCCCRRKKNKAEEYVMGSPEDGEYTDKEPHEIEEYQDKRVESKERSDHYDDRRDRDERQGRPDTRQSDSDRYDDRRSDRYDDRRADRYDDRRSDRYDDRRADGSEDRRNDRYDDRRSDRYDDRRSDYDDRRSDYDDRRSDRYDDRRSDRYDDRRRDRYDDRYDDRRDRYDHPDDRYDGRSRPPDVPTNKPTRG